MTRAVDLAWVRFAGEGVPDGTRAFFIDHQFGAGASWATDVPPPIE
jgi:hypothetical protein